MATDVGEDNMTQQGNPMGPSILMLKLAGSGNTQLVSISQDFAFLEVFWVHHHIYPLVQMTNEEKPLTGRGQGH